jgi:recombination protein RecT
MAEQNQFLALIDSRADEIRALLPKYLTPERFFVLARQVEKNPTLRACTPQSLFDCVLQAAQCGLEIGTVDQHAFIIPYGKEAQFQPSYRGMIFRLVQAGVVGSMYADVVCKNDPPPEIISGTRRELIHRPDPFKPRGETIGAYSVATMPNGTTDFELMGPDDIAAIEKAALRISGGKPSPAWSQFRNEMIKKSVIRRHAKRLQGDRRGLMTDDEAARLDLTFQATRRDAGEPEPPDDLPKGADGTDAPTPRKVKAEIVPDKPKEDRLFTETEQNDCFDAWSALGGKSTALKKFLEKEFQVDDLAKLKLSQMNDLQAKMQETLAV